jgi:hypothetical protein
MESESLDLPATEESGSPNHRSIRRRQTQRAPGIREQPRSGLFAAQFIIEAHFSSRKSLM